MPAVRVSWPGALAPALRAERPLEGNGYDGYGGYSARAPASASGEGHVQEPGRKGRESGTQAPGLPWQSALTPSSLAVDVRSRREARPGVRLKEDRIGR